jgi:hypothetical protein
MSPNRFYWGVGTLAFCLLVGGTARAQDYEVRGMQLFEPADVRPYDNWAEPRKGFFIDFDGIYWYLTAPKKTTIGDPTPVFVFWNPTSQVTEADSLDTGRFRATWKQGDRIEFGFVGDHYGFLISTIELNQQTEHIAADSTNVVFNDTPFGTKPLATNLAANWGTQAAPLYDESPVVFQHVSVVNIAKLSGVEVMGIYRPAQLPGGGSIEWMAGGRYLEFDDTFTFDGVGGVLDETTLENAVQNRIAGPQVGFRLNMPFGRVAVSVEGRAMAAVNTETVRQDGVLARNIDGLFGLPASTGRLSSVAGNTGPIPYLLPPTSFQSSALFTEFTPLVELRAEAHCRLTNLITIKGGVTGMWMDGVGRAADMVDYSVTTLTGPPMGITTANVPDANRQSLFVYGFNIGLEMNR